MWLNRNACTATCTVNQTWLRRGSDVNWYQTPFKTVEMFQLFCDSQYVVLCFRMWVVAMWKFMYHDSDCWFGPHTHVCGHTHECDTYMCTHKQNKTHRRLVLGSCHLRIHAYTYACDKYVYVYIHKRSKPTVGWFLDPAMSYSFFKSSLNSIALYVLLISIMNTLNSAIYAANLVKLCLPLPPTPTRSAFPRGRRITREMRQRCPRASLKSTRRMGTNPGS